MKNNSAQNMSGDTKFIAGIYKIVNPYGEHYVGRSKNIHTRWKDYRKLHCKNQWKLYNSLKQHGVDNHIFEVIEYCDVSEQVTREALWKRKLDSVNNGLNFFYSEENAVEWTEEMRKRASKTRTGRTMPQEWRDKISKTLMGHPSYSKPHSEETRKKLSLNVKDKKPIHKDGICRKIPKSEIEKYVNDGWTLGYLPKERPKLKRINNGVIDKMVLESEVDEFLSKGWVKGTIHKRPKKEKVKKPKLPPPDHTGKAWMNNGKKNIRVPNNHVSHYVTKGWSVGRYNLRFWVNNGQQNKMLSTREELQKYLDEGWKIGTKPLGFKRKQRKK
jgi:group I intron endonuclease